MTAFAVVVRVQDASAQGEAWPIFNSTRLLAGRSMNSHFAIRTAGRGRAKRVPELS
jgi:hypothetical protein